jgi:hypothetical protein
LLGKIETKELAGYFLQFLCVCAALDVSAESFVGKLALGIHGIDF